MALSHLNSLLAPFEIAAVEAHIGTRASDCEFYMFMEEDKQNI